MRIDQAAAARQTAYSLVLDAATVEVVAAFDGAGVPSMILKGPAIVDRLYGDGVFRPYVDIDLLIPSVYLSVATEALRRRGFVYALEGARPDEHISIRQNWSRFGDGVNVDLHTSFYGIDAGTSVWPVLSAGADRRIVGGAQLLVPADDALALITALHAAVTPPGGSKPIEDLDRAAKSFSMDVWANAVLRAEATSSVEWMSAGLRRTPRGTAIAESLGLESPRDLEILVLTHTSVETAVSAKYGAISLARLSGLDGLGSRLKYVARGLFPSPTMLRLSRGRRLPLALAYPRRWWRALRALVSGMSLLIDARRRG